MIKLYALLLVALMGSSLVPLPAMARSKVYYPNSGWCKSGKHVKNVRKCRENGGRK